MDATTKNVLMTVIGAAATLFIGVVIWVAQNFMNNYNSRMTGQAMQEQGVYSQREMETRTKMMEFASEQASQRATLDQILASINKIESTRFTKQDSDVFKRQVEALEEYIQDVDARSRERDADLSEKIDRILEELRAVTKKLNE